MTDEDLVDVLKALTHLSAGIKVLSQNLPHEFKERLAEEQQGVQAAVMAIINRHDPQPVMFSRSRSDGRMGLQIDERARHQNKSESLTVSQARPTPPRPKTDKK
jgi:hypothetical protein